MFGDFQPLLNLKIWFHHPTASQSQLKKGDFFESSGPQHYWEGQAWFKFQTFRFFFSTPHPPHPIASNPVQHKQTSPAISGAKRGHHF